MAHHGYVPTLEKYYEHYRDHYPYPKYYDSDDGDWEILAVQGNNNAYGHHNGNAYPQGNHYGTSSYGQFPVYKSRQQRYLEKYNPALLGIYDTSSSDEEETTTTTTT